MEVTLTPPDHPEPVDLLVDELRLRPWREDDLDAVVAAMQDPLLQLWNSAGSSRDGVRARLDIWRDWSSGDHCSWAVEQDGELFGAVSLHSIDRVQLNGQIGYWTVPAARGRGVAARATDAVCRWGFPTLGLDRLELFHAVENTGSGRVAAKAGFTLEGRLRRSHRYADGEKHDELLWSRLSDDPPPGDPRTVSSRS